MYRADKITTASDAQVFRGKMGFYFLDTRSDAPPVGPFKTRERAEDAADGVSIDRFYDEVARLECEPQPAADRDAREYAFFLPTKKPPVWSVCLTRQQLYAVRSALREYHARLTRECESFEYGDHRTITFDALQKVHAILLDAGVVDDTL